MPPKRAKKNGQNERKEFVWTDDETELLLSVTNDYKVRQLAEGICWESVRSKYADIAELLKKEVPGSEEGAREIGKDYQHKAEEITKEVVTTKLKAIKKKYREVRV